ncbi:MAG TPA: copper homeostasis protein CutC [Longimicrobiales bacterium]|nr:copper homeostasis protein CutC [Longimicrobiales bacterium]
MGGPHRLELCRDLDAGGLTPPAALVQAVKHAVSIPVFVMARPAAGAFHLSPAEIEAALADVELVKGAGADGVVVGFLLPDGSVDRDATAAAVDRAGPLPVTFHRAFDETPDPEGGLEVLVEAGVQRVLTAGGPLAARHNADMLAALVRQAAGRMGVLVGGRVREDHVRHLVAYTGAREVHARAAAVGGIVRSLGGV